MENYFTNSMSKDEAKSIYRKMAVKFHPDKGGSHLDMVRLSNQYEAYLKGNCAFNSKQAKETATAEADFAFNEEWVNECEGLVITICGTWIYLNGETFKYKELIKEHGFRYSKSKKNWYRAPAGTVFKKGKRGSSMGKIKSKYGSQSKTITANTSNRLN